MHPTREELAEIRDLQAVFDWVGVADDEGPPGTNFKTAFLEALGGPVLLRQVVAIPFASYERVTNTLQITVTLAGGGAFTRALTPSEEGHVYMVRRVCRLALGLPAEEGPQASGSVFQSICYAHDLEVNALRAQVISLRSMLSETQIIDGDVFTPKQALALPDEDIHEIKKPPASKLPEFMDVPTPLDNQNVNKAAMVGDEIHSHQGTSLALHARLNQTISSREQEICIATDTRGKKSDGSSRCSFDLPASEEENRGSFLAVENRSPSLNMADHRNHIVRRILTDTTSFEKSRLIKIVMQYQDVLLSVIISLNIFWLGFVQQYLSYYGEDPPSMLVIDLAFCVFFTTDVVFTVCVLRKRFWQAAGFKSRLLDAFVVVSMWVDVLYEYSKREFALRGVMPILRSIRLLRLLRIIRFLRGIAFFREIRILSLCMVSSARSFLWVFLAVGILVYLVTLVVTDGTLDKCAGRVDDLLPLCAQFGTSFRSFKTLYLSGTYGIAWGDALEALKEGNPFGRVLYVFYVTFFFFIVTNFVTATILTTCETMMREERQHLIEEEVRERQSYAQGMHEIFMEMDENQNGSISEAELMLACRNPRVDALMAAMRLDIADVQGVFHMLDGDNTGSVDQEEFVLSCLRLRGDARAIDMLKMELKQDKTNELVIDLRKRLLGAGNFQNLDANAIHSTFPDRADSPEKSVDGSSITPWSRTPPEFLDVVKYRESLRHRHEGIPIKRVEERAMKLYELHEVQHLIRSLCPSQQWLSRRQGMPLLAENVTLYDLSFNYIVPVTAVRGVTLKGLKPVDFFEPGVLVQQVAGSSVVAEGFITTVTDSGHVEIVVTMGRFVAGASKKLIFPSLDVESIDVPLTEVEVADSVSYKELVSSTPTKPKWYCTHWWGESVIDFVACCDKHAQIRSLREDDASYWVCGYANRQHGVEEELGDDPETSSFRKAMALSDGMLLVLDSKATTFRRIWCDYEFYITLNDQKPIDVSTTYDRQQHLLTDHAHRPPKETSQARSKREQHFPLQLLTDGLRLKLQDGDASRASDKTMILTSISRKIKISMGSMSEADDQDSPKHTLSMVLAGTPIDEVFSLVNKSLRGRLARAAWPQAVRRRCLEDFDQTNRGSLSLVDVLKNDESCQEVSFDLGHLTLTDADMSAVTRALPLNIRRLCLSFEGCHSVTDNGLQAFAQHLPANLEILSLDLLGCENITDVGMRALAKNIPAGLKDFQLDCTMCKNISVIGIKELARNIPDGLTSFSGNFKGTKVDRNYPNAGALLATLSKEERTRIRSHNTAQSIGFTKV